MGERRPVSEVLGTMQDISVLIQEAIDSQEPDGRQESIVSGLLDVNSYLGDFGANAMLQYPEIEKATAQIRMAQGCVQNGFALPKEKAVSKFNAALQHIQESRGLVEQAYQNPAYQENL